MKALLDSDKHTPTLAVAERDALIKEQAEHIERNANRPKRQNALRDEVVSSGMFTRQSGVRVDDEQAMLHPVDLERRIELELASTRAELMGLLGRAPQPPPPPSNLSPLRWGTPLT